MTDTPEEEMTLEEGVDLEIETKDMARINTLTAKNGAQDVGPMITGRGIVFQTGVNTNVLQDVIYSTQRRIVQGANLEEKTQEDNLDLPPK